jgi:hypothetical protein
LLVIGTTSEVSFLESIGMCDVFSVMYHVPKLKKEDAKKVMKHSNLYFLCCVFLKKIRCRPPIPGFLWKPLMGVGAGRGLEPPPAASSLASITTGPLPSPFSLLCYKTIFGLQA